MAGVSKYIDYSSDQIQAYDTIKNSLLESGVDISLNTAIKKKPHDNKIIAIIGKAGSGKTMLLADLVEAVKKSGVIVNSAEYFRAISEESRTLSILAPTNLSLIHI